MEIDGQQAGGVVRNVGVLDDDRRRGPDGAERPRGQLWLALWPIGAHRPEPPDVTEGRCEVALGEDDEAPLLPVFPVERLPLLPVLPDEPVVPVAPPVE
jgi:hypothetical protein